VEDTSTLSRPYALAVFKVAQEEGQVAQWSEMLDLLSRVASDGTMKGLISNPKVDGDKVAALIIEVCGKALSKTGGNFVRVLAQNSRLDLIPNIEKQYGVERARLEGRSHVEVRTAYELSEAQRGVVTDAMSKRLGTKVELTVELDESLIGGILVRAGDLVIDASLRGRLNQLKQSVA
jgi:F-type H+-transporting ATPase subunit delta